MYAKGKIRKVRILRRALEYYGVLPLKISGWKSLICYKEFFGVVDHTEFCSDFNETFVRERWNLPSRIS